MKYIIKLIKRFLNFICGLFNKHEGEDLEEKYCNMRDSVAKEEFKQKYTKEERYEIYKRDFNNSSVDKKRFTINGASSLDDINKFHDEVVKKHKEMLNRFENKKDIKNNQ